MSPKVQKQSLVCTWLSGDSPSAKKPKFCSCTKIRGICMLNQSLNILRGCKSIGKLPKSLLFHHTSFHFRQLVSDSFISKALYKTHHLLQKAIFLSSFFLHLFLGFNMSGIFLTKHSTISFLFYSQQAASLSHFGSMKSGRSLFTSVHLLSLLILVSSIFFYIPIPFSLILLTPFPLTVI